MDPAPHVVVTVGTKATAFPLACLLHFLFLRRSAFVNNIVRFSECSTIMLVREVFLWPTLYNGRMTSICKYVHSGTILIVIKGYNFRRLFLINCVAPLTLWFVSIRKTPQVVMGLM